MLEVGCHSSNRPTDKRGYERDQDGVFSYKSLEQLVPQDHPLSHPGLLPQNQHLEPPGLSDGDCRGPAIPETWF